MGKGAESMRGVVSRVGVMVAVACGGLAAAMPAHAAMYPGPGSISVSHWGQGTIVTFTSPTGAAPYTLTRQDPSGTTESAPCDPSGTPTTIVCAPGLPTDPGDTWTVTDAEGFTGGPGTEAPRAMWVEDVHPATGDTTSWVLPDQPANIVSTAVADGIGELFVAVPAGALSTQTAQYQSLLSDAQSAGVQVDALSGDPSWATDGGAGATTFVKDVEAYDTANPQAPFAGVHLDIEPWALASWTSDQSGTVTGYLSALEQAAAAAHSAGLSVEADITNWLDTIAVPGSSQNLAQAVQGEVDRVTIMSYESDPADQYAYAQTELGELLPNGPVRLAADTVAGDTGSYAGQTVDAVWSQLAQLDALVSPGPVRSANYLGVALFDYEGTVALSSGASAQVTVSAAPAPTSTTASGAVPAAAGFDPLADPTSPWDITVTVAGSAGGPVPTGDVSVLQGGVYLTGGPLGADGTATFVESLTSTAGLSARYSGDPTYAPSSTSTPTLTVTASDQSVLFGSAIPSLTYSYSGFAKGDSAATAVTGAPTCSTPAHAGSPGGSYPITCDRGTLSAPGYALAFAPGTLTITYSSTLTTAQRGPLVVHAGQAVLVDHGATIRGPVTVEAGGALDVEGATVDGGVHAFGTDALRVCDSRVHGALASLSATGVIVVGDDDGPTPCAGNVISGPVGLLDSSAGVEFDANTVKGPVLIAGSGGTLPAPDTGSVDVSANQATGPLHIPS